MLLVTIDTLRADRLGTYGYGIGHTPNLDRLADEGVRCDDAITVAPITMPAHASLLTGLLPPAHGVRDNGAYALAPEAVTLAEQLKAAGYATSAFVSAVVLQRRYGLDQGFDVYDDDLWDEDDPPMFMIRSRPGQQTVDRAVAWIEQLRGAEPNTPFFTWVHMFEPHHPHTSRKLRAGWMAPSSYDAEVAEADDALGRLIDALRASGQLDDTLVVVTADHGESLGEHGEQTHGLFVYDATVRVPLIWRLPGALPAGVPYPGPVSLVDVLPTIRSLLGMPAPAEIDGLDLAASIAGREPPVSRPQYSESLLAESGFGMAPLHAIRSEGWKHIRAPRPELYNLHVDPKELANVIEDEPSRRDALHQRLDAVMAAAASRSVEAVGREVDAQTQEALFALGYLAPAEERSLGGGIDPKDGLRYKVLLEQARHQVRDGAIDQADATLQELLAEVPEHVAALNLAAQVARRRRLPDVALDLYRRSLAVMPRQARIHQYIARVHVDEASFDEAEAALDASLALLPDAVEALCLLGILRYRQGRVEEAVETFARAAGVDPRAPRPHRLLGDLHHEAGDSEAALASYEQAVARGASLALLNQAALTANRAGERARAFELLDMAEQRTPEHWKTAYNRGCILALGGDADAAMTALTAAVARGLPSARPLRSDPDLQSLREEGRLDALIERARRHAPSDAAEVWSEP